MSDFRAIINEIGVDTLANWLEVKPKHIRTMRDRNSIPQNHWPSLIANCPKHMKRKLNLERLFAMRQDRFSHGVNSDRASA